MKMKETFKCGERHNSAQEQAKVAARQSLAADMHDVQVILLGKKARKNNEDHAVQPKIKLSKVLKRIEKSGVEM